MTISCRRIWHTLLLTLIATSSLAAQQIPVKNYVARARASLATGDAAAALQLVRQALAEEPGNADAHLLLGYLLLRDKDREGALDAWTRAGDLQPGWDAPHIALSEALRGGPPAWLTSETAERLPGDFASAECRLQPAGATPPRLASCRAYTPSAEASPPPSQDPKYQWAFPSQTCAYLRLPGETRWDRRAVIHCESAEDAVLARRVALLIGQLYAVAWDRLGPSAATPGEAAVWLCRHGSAGGEEWHGQLYLYEAGRARSASEWVREVAHEFGHIAIPGTRFYTEPEPLGNGYLGERLLPLWLWDAGNARLWGEAVGLAEYVRARVLPAAAAFLDVDPASSARNDRGKRGMDFAIGLVLSLDLAHGREIVDPLLRREIGSTADNLLVAYRDRIRGLQPPAFAVRARAFVPARSAVTLDGEEAIGHRLAYRVFLPAGLWTIQLEGESITPARLSIGGKTLSQAGTTAYRWSAPASGWQLLSIECGTGELRLKELRFEGG